MYFYTKNVALGEPWLSQYYSYTRTSASQEILPRDKTNRKRNKEQKTRTWSILTPDRTGDINPSFFYFFSFFAGWFVCFGARKHYAEVWRYRSVEEERLDAFEVEPLVVKILERTREKTEMNQEKEAKKIRSALHSVWFTPLLTFFSPY